MDGRARSRQLTDVAAGLAVVGPALPGDEAGVRAVLRRAVVPGTVRVAFTREPHYEAGAGLAGGEDLTVVARRGGEVVGMGQSTVHTLHRNGSPRRVAYFGLLRLLPGTADGVRLLRDGYAMLLDGLRRSRVDACFTSIADENDRARRVLEHGTKLGLPAYTRLASLVTFLAPVSLPGGPNGPGENGSDAGGGRAVGAGRPVEAGAAGLGPDRAELAAFLHAQAQGAHLTPAWNPAQWAGLARHGVAPAGFVVTRRGGVVNGAGAVWDQRAFRQTVVSGYSGGLGVVRPFVNAARALRGAPLLPPPGSVLGQGAVIGAGVTGMAAWPPLWRGLCRQAASLGLSWLVLSRDARDPDVPVLRRLLRAREYRTTLYDVSLEAGATSRDAWDSRLFRPEVGLL